MNLRRANDFGRRPGPLGIRRVDNATSNNNLVATTARNHLADVGLLLSCRQQKLGDLL